MPRALLAVLVVLGLAACGAEESPPAAKVACDRFASPGESTAQELAEALRPGEVGCLRAGTYKAEDVLRIVEGGRAGAPITIRSEAGGGARLQGTVAVEGDHVRLVGLDITGTGRANALKVYGDDVRVEGNRVSTAGRPYSCVLLGGQLGTAEDVVVRRNLLIDCGNRATNKDHGVYAGQVSGGLIEENLIVRPAAYAIQLYPNADDVRAVRNVVDGSRSVRGGIVVGGGSENSTNGVRLEGNVVRNAENALRTVWEGAVGTDNVATANCLEGFDGEPPEGLEVADALDMDDDRCDLDLEPLLRRAGVQDP